MKLVNDTIKGSKNVPCSPSQEKKEGNPLIRQLDRTVRKLFKLAESFTWLCMFVFLPGSVIPFSVFMRFITSTAYIGIRIKNSRLYL
jgi:hypothetical protein